MCALSLACLPFLAPHRVRGQPLTHLPLPDTRRYPRAVTDSQAWLCSAHTLPAERVQRAPWCRAGRGVSQESEKERKGGEESCGRCRATRLQFSAISWFAAQAMHRLHLPQVYHHWSARKDCRGDNWSLLIIKTAK